MLKNHEKRVRVTYLKRFSSILYRSIHGMVEANIEDLALSSRLQGKPVPSGRTRMFEHEIDEGKWYASS